MIREQGQGGRNPGNLHLYLCKRVDVDSREDSEQLLKMSEKNQEKNQGKHFKQKEIVIFIAAERSRKIMMERLHWVW